MTTIINAKPTSTDKIIHDISLLSLKNKHYHDYQKQPQYYYADDDTSDSTVTATVRESPKRHSDDQNQNWIHEIEHSFNINDDFYDYHQQSMIQSYLEPHCEAPIVHSQKQQQQQPQPQQQKSKFSIIKSRVKRVFRFSSSSSTHNQPSLPVISPTSRWNPSIESICSSTTTAGYSTASTLRPPDVSSSNTSSTASFSSSYKSYTRRSSCGIMLSSSPFRHEQRSGRFSTVAKLKDKLGRSSSLGTFPITAHHPVKSILKKNTRYTNTTRPKSAIEIGSPSNRQRWSAARLSMHQSKRQYSILKRSSKALLNDETKGIRFNKMVDIYETYSKVDYDRSSDSEAVCTRLTAMIATQIKQELNEYKLHEMVVHNSSRIHTHFFL